MSNFPDERMNEFEVAQYEAGGATDAKNDLANDYKEKEDATTQPTTAAQNGDATSQMNNADAQNGDATTQPTTAAQNGDATSQTNNGATQNAAAPTQTTDADAQNVAATTQTTDADAQNVAAPPQTNNGATQNDVAPQAKTEATAAENAQFMAGLEPDPNANAGRGRKPSTILPPPITKVTPPAWNLGKTPATPTTPAKPRLTVTLALNAPEVSEKEIDEFYSKTLFQQRLSNPKVKEAYRSDLDLGALFRQTVGDTAEFQFSLVDVDPKFKENHGLSCALDGDVLVVQGVPTQPFDGEIELRLKYKCRRTYIYSYSGFDKFDSLIPDPPSETPKDPQTIRGDGSGQGETCRLPFTIHQDSWDLWKVVEPPKDAPYPTLPSDKFAAPLLGSDKFLLVASQRGRSHEHDGKFRDDSFAVKPYAVDGWNFFAIGDGAGSAKFSRKGSQIACDTIVENLANYFKANADAFATAIEQFRAEAAQTPERAFLDGNGAPELVPVIFQHALFESLMAIYEEVDKRNQQRKPDEKEAQLRDYHTTLLCGALKKFDDGWVLLSYWIGDGGFALYRPNGEDRALALGKPDGGEFAGQTRFFTMPEEIRDLAAVKNRVRVSFVSDFDALALATDGVSDPYFETENDLGAFEAWQKFWQARQEDEIFHNVFNANLDPAQRAENLTQGLRFKIKGHHDDRTLLLVLNPETFAAPSPEQSESSDSSQPEIAPSENKQSPEGEN